MATINSEDVEAEARNLLRKQIQDSSWYPGLKRKEREERIEGDVERYWHLKITEASQRLLDRTVGDGRRMDDEAIGQKESTQSSQRGALGSDP
jgi:hypothetical protein